MGQVWITGFKASSRSDESIGRKQCYGNVRNYDLHWTFRNYERVWQSQYWVRVWWLDNLFSIVYLETCFRIWTLVFPEKLLLVFGTVGQQKFGVTYFAISGRFTLRNVQKWWNKWLRIFADPLCECLKSEISELLL